MGSLRLPIFFAGHYRSASAPTHSTLHRSMDSQNSISPVDLSDSLKPRLRTHCHSVERHHMFVTTSCVQS